MWCPLGPSGLQCRDSLRGGPSMSWLRKLTPLQKICFIRAMRIDCLKAMWIPKGLVMAGFWLGMFGPQTKQRTPQTYPFIFYDMKNVRAPERAALESEHSQHSARDLNFQRFPQIAEKYLKGLACLKKRFLHHLRSSRLLWSRSSPSRSVISLWSHPPSTSASRLPIRLLGMSRVEIAPWCFLNWCFFLFFSAAEVAFHFFLFSTFPIVPYISILHDFISYNHLRSSLRYDPRSSSYLPVLVQHVSHVFSQQPSLGIHLSLINRSKHGSHPIPDAPCM